MNSKFARIVTPALVALALSGPGPAEAGGSFGFSITASNGRERTVLNRFLKSYAGAGTAAQVTQRGHGNAAAISQTGKGNRAVVGQYGDGHTGSVSQQGRGNRFGLFQFGEATDVAVRQSGRRSSTVMFVGGW